MSRHLCISVTLLDGRFHGLGDDGAPEWPPSPWRLYQALLAGGHAGCRAARWTEAQSAAMRWLAKLDPPRILAPAARTAQAYTLWVPNNDHDIIWRAYAKHRQPKKSPADLRTAKPTRPTLLLDPPDSTSTKTDSVYWLYPLDDWPDNFSERSENVTELQRIASGIHSLGWGVDAAIASVSIINGDDALPGQLWEPAPLGVVTDRMLRTPAPDALIELSRCHESFMCRLEGGVYKPAERPGERAFNLTGYYPRTQLPARPVAAFGLRATDGSDAWFRGNPTLTNHIAAMVRHVACESAKFESNRFPGGSNAYVRGKVDQSNNNPVRFSYLPLPTVGHPHADGLVRRVLIAEQAGGNGTQASWAAQRLRGVSLIDAKTGDPAAILEFMPSPDKVTRRYLRMATDWSTVTPVILPGFDDGKLKKRDALVHKAIRQAGIPIEAVESFTLRKAPFWPGSQHPRQYRRPNYLKHYPGWHVHLSFGDAVSGPIAIGAGRHCGLGIFAVNE